MISYPTALDMTDFATLLPVLGGDVSNPKHKIHAAYDLAGFALGQLAPDDIHLKPAASNLDGAHYFQHVAEAHAKGSMQASAIDWKKILNFVITNILPLLLPLITTT